MINGIGVVGWGVGGIEAEAGMLGQPVYFLTPDVVGVELTGKLTEGVTATDLVLTVTEMLRKEKVVGKFVEFFGEGTATLARARPRDDRQHGARIRRDDGLLPRRRSDRRLPGGHRPHRRRSRRVRLLLQGAGTVRHAARRRHRLHEGREARPRDDQAVGRRPKRPQDRIELGNLKAKFTELFSKPVAENGFAKSAADLAKRIVTARVGDGVGAISDASMQVPGNGQPRDLVEMVDNRPTPDRVSEPDAVHVSIGNGDVLIAAITSCTNTSNPGVLLAAGLLAKKAVETAASRSSAHIKTSLAPGSRVVTDYLTKAGLLPYLEQLGFGVAAYGCTTCIGNAGDLAPEFNDAIVSNDLICAAVLSGNRNFEARIHPNLKANFLASPPLVVAYAIAGTVLRDLTTEPLGMGRDGKPVFLKDIWPTSHEIAAVMPFARDPATFRKLYGSLATANPLWGTIQGATGQVYAWPTSTYIAKPPFFDGFKMTAIPTVDIKGARIAGHLRRLDHHRPHLAGRSSIKADSPAGKWLLANGVAKADFNSYGSRRGNHEVMMRGTFANVRIKNLMLPPRADGTREEGGVTLFQPSGEKMFIYDAAMKYIAQGTPTVVFGGEEYGTGSSRDWAAKGTQLLGVKAVVAKSFERIHRSNLVGMGVLPLQFKGGDTAQSLGIKGDETGRHRRAQGRASRSRT